MPCELADAARALGVVDVELLDFADGGLDGVAEDELVARIQGHCEQHGTEGLLVFDPAGITGHPDHCAATAGRAHRSRSAGRCRFSRGHCRQASRTSSARRPACGSSGATDDELDFSITVSRERQRDAVSCHPSQAVPGSALWRRLELLGNTEHLMWLRRP